ncbi:CsbD family protein [Geotalea uraniireducens]|uniref:CsbD family protein n=1 Tax=Geotalea uraniireducens (strain Rf4) TaxID=351605 RepID=A5G466_GEOUR|nr:CsbD family protein [Geotalea uraniireducens]ABQ26584.1 CsbD family protein [Geotalea uraniireducens Rf4]
MKSSIRDKAEGTFHEAKGKVKEIAGKITDNPKLEAKGKGEKLVGKVQEKIGQVKKVLGK